MINYENDYLSFIMIYSTCKIKHRSAWYNPHSHLLYNWRPRKSLLGVSELMCRKHCEGDIDTELIVAQRPMNPASLIIIKK